MGFRFIAFRLVWYALVIVVPLLDKLFTFEGKWYLIYALPFLTITYMLAKRGKALLTPPLHYKIPDIIAFLISIRFADYVLETFFFSKSPNSIVLKIAIRISIGLGYALLIRYFLKERDEEKNKREIEIT